MLLKLFKHEWNATRKTMGLLTIAALGIGLLATVALRVLIAIVLEMSADKPLMGLAVAALALFLMACFLALCAYVLAVQLMLLFRFYKNKFTDEGYLTFTLPVSVKDIFWSSLLNMLLWQIISIAVLLVIGGVFISFGTATKGVINTELLQIFGEIFKILLDIPWSQLFGTWQTVAIVVFYVLILLIAPFYSAIVPMTCITWGAVLAKKHKLLTAFGVYYGLNTALGIISSVLTMIPTVFISITYQDEGLLYASTLFISLLLTAGITLAGYFFTTHLMKNKLNLP